MKALAWLFGLVFLGNPAVIAAFIAAFYAYSHNYIRLHTYTYNMRLTLEIDTPEGPRSASSVMGYKSHFEPKVAFFSDQGDSMTGEAVFVDLPAGPDGAPRHVIALLAGGPTAQNGDLVRGIPRRVIAWPRHEDSSSSRGPRARRGRSGAGARQPGTAA